MISSNAVSSVKKKGIVILPMTEINSLADLRPGDIVFTNIGGFFPGFFPVKCGQWLIGERVRLGPLSIDHVGVVVEAEREVSIPGTESANEVGVKYLPPRMVQAMPGGAEEVPMHPDDYWKPDVAFLRLREDYPGQAMDAAYIARLFVSEKVKYSFGSYGMLAIHHWGIHSTRLERRIDRRRDPVLHHRPSDGAQMNICLPQEAICSVLADQSWTLAGKSVMQGVAKQVVTPGALALRYWRDNTVVWGGAGLN